MPDNEPQPLHQQLLKELTDLIHHGTISQVREKLQPLHPAEIAHLLESLPQDLRESVLDLINPAIEGEILVHLQDEIRAPYQINFLRRAGRAS